MAGCSLERSRRDSDESLSDSTSNSKILLIISSDINIVLFVDFKSANITNGFPIGLKKLNLCKPKFNNKGFSKPYSAAYEGKSDL